MTVGDVLGMYAIRANNSSGAYSQKQGPNPEATVPPVFSLQFNH